jgi:pyruvate dehydrogenase E1 component alpha subunit
MGDPERYRKPEEIEERRSRDPIELWGAELVEDKVATPEELEKLEKAAEHEVEEAVEFAKASPLPTEEDLYEDVYA